MCSTTELSSQAFPPPSAFSAFCRVSLVFSPCSSCLSPVFIGYAVFSLQRKGEMHYRLLFVQWWPIFACFMLLPALCLNCDTNIPLYEVDFRCLSAPVEVDFIRNSDAVHQQFRCRSVSDCYASTVRSLFSLAHNVCTSHCM